MFHRILLKLWLSSEMFCPVSLLYSTLFFFLYIRDVAFLFSYNFPFVQLDTEKQ